MTTTDLIRKIQAEHIDVFGMPEIMEKRRIMLESFRNTSPKGEKVEFMGREYVVFPNVFRPYFDTRLLIENYYINPGESVLDLFTGSGVIAIDAARRGAKEVVAVDKSENAIKAATVNVYLHGVSDAIELLQRDVCPAGFLSKQFDVITANPPFAEKDTIDEAEATLYYQKDFHYFLFANVCSPLKSGGRAYVLQSNYGHAEKLIRLAEEMSWGTKLLAEGKPPQKDDPRKYYLFEMRRK